MDCSTESGRRWSWTTWMLIGALIGVIVAWAAGLAPQYAVTFISLWVIVLSLAGVLGGLLLLAFSRTRPVAGRLLLAIVVMFASHFSALAVMDRIGVWNAYQIRVGPDVPADLVVLFDVGATSADITDFVDTQLSVPDPRGGHQHRPGVQSILLVRVGGHQGYAVRFHEHATLEQRSSVKDRLLRSPLVWKVFEGIAPSEIHLDRSAA